MSPRDMLRIERAAWKRTKRAVRRGRMHEASKHLDRAAEMFEQRMNGDVTGKYGISYVVDYQDAAQLLREHA